MAQPGITPSTHCPHLRLRAGHSPCAHRSEHRELWCAQLLLSIHMTHVMRSHGHGGLPLQTVLAPPPPAGCSPHRHNNSEVRVASTCSAVLPETQTMPLFGILPPSLNMLLVSSQHSTVCIQSEPQPCLQQPQQQGRCMRPCRAQHAPGSRIGPTKVAEWPQPTWMGTWRQAYARVRGGGWAPGAAE